MPIRRDLRPHYGVAWRALARQLREERAGNRCEGEGCTAVHGGRHPVTGSLVALNVAHLDHDPTHHDPARLRVLCQRCHLAHDREHHLLSRRRNAGRPDLLAAR